jgi:sec-independent protein translocase protein TatA
VDLGPSELLIILVVVLVLFGGAKLPQLARSLGQAKNEFERGIKGDQPTTPPRTHSVEPEPAPVSRQPDKLVAGPERQSTPPPADVAPPAD